MFQFVGLAILAVVGLFYIVIYMIGTGVFRSDERPFDKDKPK